ncbi:glycoside hydrolase family 15 protein [Pseudoalteromonas xiamenensis]|uniref:glucan 1,4-alpha-glucosidase n=1 Tax=Pseudoalteromonas xiamenensis TaxID=882626 RepID=A0A975DKL8_9GAMM|nr:glycoside hydrolase family 15 protein [Pseudoalteromonas xiamenensis]QTH73576.1 glycoside hydrolase family 15 protein [Pseudoalteromonas xiamenensis]
MTNQTNTALSAESECATSIAAEPLDKWAVSARQHVLEKMIANISPDDGERGAVLASPSRSNPNYYYHWIRDAARTMSEIAKLNGLDKKNFKDQNYERMIEYVEFSKINQTTPTISNSPGEPKFKVTGQAFNGPWGRPQNDGPAQRALTLTRWANILLANNEKDYVTGTLYDGQEPSFSLIKADLDFVANHWQDPCFDLWEEVDGTHFYTRMLQRTALREGADLATLLNDKGAADYYNQQATLIENAFDDFWNEEKRYYVATLNRVGGLDYKTSNLDVATTLGVCQALSDSHPFLSADNDKILATAYALHQAFNPLYPINSIEHIESGEPVAPGIGRYPEDKYAGSAPLGEGNPWFLCTASLAGVCYKAAALFAEQKTIEITPYNADQLNLAAQLIDENVILKSGDNFNNKTKVFKTILLGLKALGDAYLRRIQIHAGENVSLSEQFSRYNGYMTSANDLTWSYVSVAICIDLRNALKI